MSSEQKRILIALLRKEFLSFVEKTFNHLNPGTAYVPNWHVEVIVYQLIRCLSGRVTRQVILLPPRHLKSTIVSVAFPAFVLGHFPWMKFICASYGQDLANKLSNDCRSVMTSEWYRQIFPKTQISEKNSQEFFETTAHGGRLATSVGGTLTGFGADFIVVDDPQKPADMSSESARHKARDWMFNTLMSRFDDPKTGRLVLVMQRLHEDDLVGNLANDESYHVLKIPVRAEEELLFDAGDVAYRFNAGSYLHKGRFGLVEFEQKRREMGTREFSAQYQQNPLPADGGLFDLNWFRLVDELPKISELFMSVDVAVTQGAGNYTAITLWGHFNGQWYLIAAYRYQYDFAGVRETIEALNKKYRPDLIVVDQVGVGAALVSALRQSGHKHIQGVGATVNKAQRANDIIAMAEGGQISILTSAIGIKEFRNEVVSFPNGKFDDLVDSMTQLLRYAGKAVQEARLHKRPERQGINSERRSNITVTTRSIPADPRRYGY